VGLRAGLDAVAKRTNPCPCRECLPSLSVVTIQTELPRLPQSLPIPYLLLLELDELF